MNAELLVQLSVGGRPFWIKKKEVGGVMTKRLTDAEYDMVVDAAATALAVIIEGSEVPVVKSTNREPIGVAVDDSNGTQVTVAIGTQSRVTELKKEAVRSRAARYKANTKTKKR